MVKVATSTETREAPAGKARRLSACGQPAPATRRISPFAICPSVSTTNSFSRARTSGLQILEGIAPKHRHPALTHDGAGVVVTIYQVNRHTRFRLAGLQHCLEHSIPIHPRPAESRQEGRVSVEDSALESPEYRGVPVSSCNPPGIRRRRQPQPERLESPRPARPDPRAFSKTNERPEHRPGEPSSTRQSRHCCSRQPRRAPECGHRNRHPTGFEASFPHARRELQRSWFGLGLSGVPVRGQASRLPRQVAIVPHVITESGSPIRLDELS